MTTSTRLDRKLLAGLLAASALLLTLLAPSAKAGLLTATTPDCDHGDASRVFLPWGDIARYSFAPDGGFESGADGWGLSDDAEVVVGNSSHYAHSDQDKRSLALPAGSSALSPPVCVGLEHPTLRFFAKDVSGALESMIVSVRTMTELGVPVELPVGVVTPTGSWQPTLPMPVVANLLPVLPGKYASVQFRFTPLTGGWRIDDLYIDPVRRS